MNNEKMCPYTICFTGHREIKHADLSARLDALIADLYAQGFRHFRVGGALGFDTEAALSVLRVREQRPEVKLILILPFPEQMSKWSAEQREQYEDIKRCADEVTYTSEKQIRGTYHIRNRALVSGAGLCVAYLYKNEGGTYYTVQYAERQSVRVINVAE